MLPTIVAREARENLLDYLRATFGLKDEEFERVLFEHLSGGDGLFRGPYLDVRLPFRQVVDGAKIPLDVRPGFTPYRHQMRSFQRLHSMRGHQPQHTLVTTGTGSGKTECFLYPVLDHCLRERAKGRKGIKAILLYPMNALATDQARRLAKVLWDDDRLKGVVTAGLYVGGEATHPIADRDHLIDDRKVLRQSPPDILLTNYKMLDFMLMRPEDQVLWRGNE
ncbi:MAG: DEAD/DEAH box helicase, partial [Planctomycetes bacterium]|nr:DEAD/DEAH box helicase [Planctomycetota bacterium]